jgi:hypothetical protein
MFTKPQAVDRTALRIMDEPSGMTRGPLNRPLGGVGVLQLTGDRKK